jgi:hypothetical protein
MEATRRGSILTSRRGSLGDGKSGGESNAETLSPMLFKVGLGGFGLVSLIGKVQFDMMLHFNSLLQTSAGLVVSGVTSLIGKEQLAVP